MNTFTLKMTALIMMVLDHIGCYFDGAPVWLNWLGRLSYPLFLFCMVQGYRHTRSRKRYLLRLYLMSLFMTGFSYFLDSRFPTPNGYGNHNIFLPLLLTGVLISTIEWFGREDSFPVRAAMRTAHGINAARCPLPAGCPLVQARLASSGRIAQKDRRKGFFLLGGLFGVQLLYYVLPHRKEQVAPDKGVLPPEQQPRQGVDPKDRRPPGRKGAEFRMGLIETEIPLGRAVLHDGGQLFAVNDLVAPGTGGQVDAGGRHAVQEPFAADQERQRRCRHGGGAQPRPLTPRRTPEHAG